MGEGQNNANTDILKGLKAAKSHNDQLGGITYTAPLNLKDLMQRNPVTGVYYLGKYLDYLNS
ncbi:MAG: hypothetical protein K2X86_05740 [Cytophagaceae bacterium]|nr:hypothetical protein [Cytophagaceae bacterium]